MLEFKELIENVFDTYLKNENTITIELFHDALIGAIKSGDFLKHVKDSPRASINGEILELRNYMGISYIPYRERLELESVIERLHEENRILRKKLSSVNQIVGRAKESFNVLEESIDNE